uniref:homocysteine S-methyltransferase family protein n=1 Tax=Faecalibacterium prausnitzii TaxID=853 RepID=UPI004025EFA0
MQASELFNQPNTILLDGGMGTMLQAAGMKLGTRPEDLNIENPELIRSIHAKYAAAGSRVVNANTFGASPHKLADSKYTLEEVITAGIANCKQAVAPYGALVTLDVGPLGELLEPSGTLAFEDAVAEYGRIVRAGVAAGADILYFETFTDLYEMKAALLAAKENSTLPIMASMSFEANGRTFTGCTVESFAATARGLGANAVGINCSLGPKEIFPMAKRLAEAVPGDFPVFVKPNAGLPRADGSGYDITPQLYAMQMKPYRELHLFAAGGCCGTTPEFIQMLNGVFADCKPGRPEHPMLSVICSPVDCVNVDGITVVGERINPTGKKRFQQALRDGDMNYILEQAVSQAEAGAQILDVNVGAPGVDEPALMEQVVKALQSVVSLPLQLDSSHAEALERGLRVYNGKPIVNSVNGEPEVLEKVLPLCKKYGAAVVGLAIDERGIQPKAEDRVAIARRIKKAALEAGIPQEDIYIDCLTLTASAQQEDVLATVQALHTCKTELGVRTILGVSNISFGLPCRPYLNTTFLTMAMYAGLDLAIMNPSSEEMMAAVYAYNVLTNRDKQSGRYIARYADRVPASAALAKALQDKAASGVPAAAEAAGPAVSGPYAPLMKAVEQGLKGEAAACTKALLAEKEPLELVDEALIPALDIVGVKYEKGKLFLPQLLQAASAAQSAFDEIKTAIAQRGGAGASKGRIVLATVKGDVHDIGKNIVKVILENYGFEVIDLGRDVPVETVVETVREKDVHLVGLSALMTTTLKSMEETIAALHAAKLDCKVMVGGAVLTPEYAEKIGADWYAKDAKQSADIAKEFFGA